MEKVFIRKYELYPVYELIPLNKFDIGYEIEIPHDFYCEYLEIKKRFCEMQTQLKEYYREAGIKEGYRDPANKE